jgi:hypothetical protein
MFTLGLPHESQDRVKDKSVSWIDVSFADGRQLFQKNGPVR